MDPFCDCCIDNTYGTYIMELILIIFITINFVQLPYEAFYLCTEKKPNAKCL